ncbi:AAA family ATPase [Candidatus Bipolaricaulota bacterium]
MIHSYSFRNYKAFEKGEIVLKPITILIGANSVGKTSILELLLLMQQTALEATSKYRSALKPHGRYVSAGHPSALFLNGQTRRQLGLEFGFDSRELGQLLSKQLLAQLAEGLRDAIRELYGRSGGKREFPEDLMVLHGRLAEMGRGEPGEELREEFLNQAIERISEEAALLPSQEEEAPGRLRLRLHPDSTWWGDGAELGTDILSGIDSTDFRRLTDFINGASRLKGSRFVLGFGIGFSTVTGLLYLRRLTLRCGEATILELLLTDRGKAIRSIRSDLTSMSLDRLAGSVSRYLNPQGSVFHIFNSERRGKSLFASLIRQILNRAISDLAADVGPGRIQHVSPIRAYPKRFYFLDVAGGGSAQGETLVETLREDLELRSRVNSWLKRFHISVDVAQIETLIYRLAVKQEGLKLDLDITDVGFGVSQVLPVFVEVLQSQEDSITLVEQPEIHLHPKMQAELADFFIEVSGDRASTGKGKRVFVIETHSEYFLNRIRRRLSAKEIAPADVAIYYVHPSESQSGTKLEEIEVPTNGDFQWPREFYVTDLEDTIEFLSHQE